MESTWSWLLLSSARTRRNLRPATAVPAQNSLWPSGDVELSAGERCQRSSLSTCVVSSSAGGQQRKAGGWKIAAIFPSPSLTSSPPASSEEMLWWKGTALTPVSSRNLWIWSLWSVLGQNHWLWNFTGIFYRYLHGWYSFQPEYFTRRGQVKYLRLSTQGCLAMSPHP